MTTLQRAPGFWCGWRVLCRQPRRLSMASDLTQLRERAA